MTALLPGSKIAGALPAGKAGGSIVSGGSNIVVGGGTKLSKSGGTATANLHGWHQNAVSGDKLSKEPIWSSGTTSGGEYLSVADRKAIFRKQKINAAKFIGKSSSAGIGVSGGSKFSAITPTSGGGLVPTDKAKGDVVPETKKVRDLEVLKRQVGANSKKITLLKNIVKSIQKRFGDFLVKDAKREEDKLLKEQKQQLKAAESNELAEKEGFLETIPKKIGKALLSPLKSVGGRVQGILQKLMDTFTLLFAGWMTNKGIKTIKAWMDGDQEKLKELRNNVLGGLGVVGGLFLAMNLGFLALPGLLATLGGSVLTIGGAILGFLVSPPGLIALAVAAGIGGIGFGLKAAQRRAAGGKGFDASRTKTGEMEDKMNKLGVIKTTKGAKVSVNGVMKDVMQHGTEEQKAAYTEYQNEEKRLDDLKKNMDKEIKDGKKAYFDRIRENEPEKQPEKGKYWDKARKDWNVRQSQIKARYNDLALGVTGTGMGNIPAGEGDAKISGKKINPEFGKVTPGTSIVTAGPVKDPDPNIITKTAPSTPGQSGGGGSNTQNTKVPNIQSSNPDNFYVMYSKMHYNVVT